jgi:aspartyl-tRNA(Asn)/glutamyl-tRNA(Gln) amidotransferase subunit C
LPAVNPKIDLDHICTLANLKLTEEDKKLLEPQMIKIIKWVNKLEELEIDISKGELDSSVSLSLPFREDKIKPSLPTEEALASSPEKSEGFIKVPKVIEEK